MGTRVRDRGRIVVFTVLPAWAICVVLFTVVGAIRAGEHGGGFGDYVARGWIVGLLLGAVIALIRILPLAES